MFRVCFLFALFALSNAVSLRSSVVVTSADMQGQSQLYVPGLASGILYRVYATFATGDNYNYATNVWISDTYGAKYSLAMLAQAKPGSNYILSEINFLKAPITIFDNNNAGTRVPFTVYMVDSYVGYYPVASAQLAVGAIDSQYGFWAAGITVLSAEKYFTMYNFDIGSFPNMYISSAGFDDPSLDYNVMYIGSQSQARISFLTVYGPIATLYNTNFGTNRFQFQFSKNTPYNVQLAPGASFAFLSPGYLSQYLTYNIPYTVTEAFNQAYTFGDSNWMHADFQAHGVSPSSIQLRFTSSGGDNRDVVSTFDENQNYGEAFGNRISFTVNTNGGPSPRFLYKITSVCFLFSLFALSHAVILSNSVILTSADVPQTTQAQIYSTQTGLYNGAMYRVFGTFASGNTAEYASRVIVSDNYGYSFTLARLAQAKPGSDYILSDINFLKAPIQIWDQNTGARVPFTLYIVDASIVNYPVASAQLAAGAIDSQYGFWAAGITVLSAEKYFTMFNFDIGSFPSLYVSSVGFDELSSDYRIMYMRSQSEARISFVTIYGPIATLYNSNIGSSRFQFQFTKNTPYSNQLSPGASFAFLSPGYLSRSDSYKLPYTISEAYDRAYTFGDSNWMYADYQAFLDNPTTLQLRFTSSGGDNRDVVSTSDEQNHGEAFGNRISLNVNTNGGRPPRFLYKITSSSALSFSFLGMLLVAPFSTF